ncbi:MAG: flippase-like domain-containing protein [Bacteroidales bacterium]|nr:flippase-like domain-containing protein [Bacteroidales bacterium]
MNPKFVKALQFVFFLLVGLVLLYFAFRDIDLDELILQIRQADYRWVALSVFFAVLALVFRAFRWRLLIEPLGEHPKVTNIFHAINIGYLANFVFPRIGEITRCGILNRTDHVPVDRLFGTVIVERIFDMLMAVLMLCFILVLRFDVVENFIMKNILQPVIKRMPDMISIGWVVAIVILVIIAFYVFYRIFRAQLSKIGALRKIRDLMYGVIKGIKSVYRIRNFGLFVVLNFLVFGMYFMQTYTMFFALKSTSSLGLGDALFVLVLSSLSFVIPVQGGIGAYHWTVSMGLTIFGLTREEGMVYATISHSVTSIVLILLGAMSMIYAFYGDRLRKKADVNEDNV